jgi:hypothetical protein
MTERKKLDSAILELDKIKKELTLVSNRKRDLSKLKKEKEKTLFLGIKLQGLTEYKGYKEPDILKVKKKEKEKREETFSLLAKYGISDKEKVYAELKLINKMKVIPQQ